MGNCCANGLHEQNIDYFPHSPMITSPNTSAQISTEPLPQYISEQQRLTYFHRSPLKFLYSSVRIQDILFKYKKFDLKTLNFIEILRDSESEWQFIGIKKNNSKVFLIKAMDFNRKPSESWDSHPDLMILVHELLLLDIVSEEKAATFAPLRGIIEDNPSQFRKTFLIITEIGSLRLEDLLKFRKSLSEGEIFGLVCPFLKGLLEANKKLSLCHRDLSVSKITLNISKQKVFDAQINDMQPGYCEFLIENKQKESKGNNLFSITPGYSPPEVVASFQAVEKTQPVAGFDVYKIDVFSIGIIILRMMGVELKEMEEKIDNNQEMEENYINLKKIVTKMTEKNVQKRCSLEEIITEFEKHKGDFKDLELQTGESNDFDFKKRWGSTNPATIQKILHYFEKNIKIPEIVVQNCELILTKMPIVSKNSPMEEIEKNAEISLIYARNLIEGSEFKKAAQILNNLQSNLDFIKIPSKKNAILTETLLTLARLSFIIENYQESIDYYKKSLNLSQSPDTIDIHIEISDVYRETKDYLKAIESLDNALTQSIKKYGQHPITAKIYSRKAFIMRIKKDFVKSMELYKKALETYRKTNEKSSEIAEVLNSLSIVAKALNKKKEALEFQTQALKIKIDIFGESSLEAANSYNNLGNIYKEMQSYKKSLELYEKSLEIKKSNLGEEDLKIAVSLNNLGNLHSTLKNFEKALECHEKAYQIRKKKLGNDDPLVAMSLNNLGEVYREMMNYDKALKIHQMALNIRETKEGSGYNTTLSRFNVGLCMLHLRKFAEAEPTLKTASEEFKTLVGENSEEYLECIKRLGECYEETGDRQNYNQSVKLVREKTLSKK